MTGPSDTSVGVPLCFSRLSVPDDKVRLGVEPGVNMYIMYTSVNIYSNWT